MTLKCKDCDTTTEIEIGPDLLRAGWEHLTFTDPHGRWEEEDEVNGWRCPKCIAGWKIIINEQRGNLQS